MKLPSIPLRDDLAARARGLAGQAASGAAKAADTEPRRSPRPSLGTASVSHSETG